MNITSKDKFTPGLFIKINDDNHGRKKIRYRVTHVDSKKDLISINVYCWENDKVWCPTYRVSLKKWEECVQILEKEGHYVNHNILPDEKAFELIKKEYTSQKHFYNYSK